MALIKCKECGKDISDTAINCPYCGNTYTSIIEKEERYRKSIKKLLYFFVFGVIIIALLFISGNIEIALLFFVVLWIFIFQRLRSFKKMIRSSDIKDKSF